MKLGRGIKERENMGLFEKNYKLYVTIFQTNPMNNNGDIVALTILALLSKL